MSSFSPDKNLWYQFHQIFFNLSMVATPVYDKNATAGSVFFQPSSLSEPGQLWNFFPVGSGSYVLRTSRSPHVYLDVDQSKTPVAPYMTIASLMTNGSIWEISSWGNGGYYLTNHGVGVQGKLMMDMATHLVFGGSDTNLQTFAFNQTTVAINDLAYSSIDAIPGVIITSSTTSKVQTESTVVTPQSRSTTISSSDIQVIPTATIISTATIKIQPTLVDPQPTLSSTPFSISPTAIPLVQANHGISPGAIAGIGVSIGVVLILFLGYFFFWRRRKTSGPVHELEAKTSLAEVRFVTRKTHELEAPAAELQGTYDNRWELPDAGVKGHTL